jgi:hypothetical protein
MNEYEPAVMWLSETTNAQKWPHTKVSAGPASWTSNLSSYLSFGYLTTQNK